MRRNIGQIRIPVCGFTFCDEEDDPNLANPGSGEPPTQPVAPMPPEPKSPEQIIEELKSSPEGRKAYDILFGRGVTKGQSNQKKLPLDDTQVQAAIKLFEKVKPEDVEKLLQAQKEARQAAIEKAAAEKNFNEYSERIAEQHRAELEQASKASATQITALKEQVSGLEAHCAKLKAALEDSRITKELLSAAKVRGLIDPSDAVVQLAGTLALNDDLEITDKTGQIANISVLIENLVQSKPHLVGSSQKPGEGTSPQAPHGASSVNPEKRTYKRSELRDPAFYREHEADILLASKENRIIDDIGKK